MSQLRNAIIANLGGGTPPTPPTPINNGIFKFTVDTSKGGNTNYFGAASASFTTEWGDGTTDTSSSHTYETQGIYQIKVTFANPTAAFSSFRCKNRNLISIDSPLPTATNAYAFDGICEGAPFLSSVNKDLFMFNTQLTELTDIFSGCTSLKSIPLGLFDNLTSLQWLDRAFLNSGLETLPQGIFDGLSNLVRATSFFEGCTSLTSVPEYLFRYTTKFNNFDHLFSGCTKLKLNRNIFCDEDTESGTRFNTSAYCYFTYAFERSSYTNTEQGTAPALWNYTIRYKNNTTYCFSGAGNNSTSLSNYSLIPSTWGGPA